MTTPREQRPNEPTDHRAHPAPARSIRPPSMSRQLANGRSRDRMFLKSLHELVGGGRGWRIAAAK